MKISHPQTDFSKFLFACVAVGLALTSRTASAQMMTLISPTVNNGGFESTPTTKPLFTSPTSSTTNIPYWGATLLNAAGTAVAAPTDSGAENDGGTIGNTGNNAVAHTGTYGAFWQPTGSSTAFNLVTTNPIVAGNIYTLTWYGRTTGGGGAQVVTLFSQLASTVTGGTYTYQPSATLITANGLNDTNYALTAANGPFALYTLTYKATATDAGKLIGLTYGSSGTAYIGADDFTLTSAVPEPSTYALLFAGLGGVLLVGRFRRASA